ncbi:spore maturation protein B [Catenibacillus scindens]|uniref:Spore maturation protein B n=1 Tax=Catenibacillus scindens TaxID=673271 RepID=A0A7W8H8X7_9FIRM|nr:nucleoside recognition domain-containing protein [Catenibacillus scindens]MBB5264061.1 spore maturation protein B [Catenibacillus scindens]
MAAFSAYILPVVVILIVVYGVRAKVKVYDTFVEGAKEGLGIVADILPTLAGLMLAVGVLRASSAFDLLGDVMGPLLDKLHMAVEVFTLVIVKMFSSSASTGLLLDIYKNYGTDSYNGLAASLILSSTETIFYTMSVYFMAAKITKTRYTLKGALLATAAGTGASMVLAGLMM